MRENLQTWVRYEQERLAEIIDADLGNDLDVDEACRFLKIGLLCTQDAMARRPNMSTVVRMLTGEKHFSVHRITRPAMITDFADLKVSSSQQKENETTRSSNMRSFSTTDETEPFSSSETPTQTSIWKKKNKKKNWKCGDRTSVFFVFVYYCSERG